MGMIISYFCLGVFLILIGAVIGLYLFNIIDKAGWFEWYL